MKMVSDDEFLDFVSKRQKLKSYRKKLEKEYISFRKYGFFNLTEFRDKALIVKASKIKQVYFFSKTVTIILSLYLFVFLVSRSVSSIDIIFGFISMFLSFVFLITGSIYKEKYKDLLCDEISIVDSDIERIDRKISCLENNFVV